MQTWDALAEADGRQMKSRIDGTSVIVAIPHAGAWLVCIQLDRVRDLDHWRVIDFHVRVNGDAGTITGQSLRDLPLGELIAQARAEASKRIEPRSATTSPFANPEDHVLSGFKVSARGKGRPDRDFAELALEYMLLVNAGDRAPAKTLAAKHGGTSSAWVNRVLEARRRGMLTKVGRGEAGGELTAEAEVLLFGSNGEGE